MMYLSKGNLFNNHNHTIIFRKGTSISFRDTSLW